MNFKIIKIVILKLASGHNLFVSHLIISVNNGDVLILGLHMVSASHST